MNEASYPPEPVDVPGTESAAAIAERLRQRYPRPRLPRPVRVGIVALVATAGLGWLIWAAAIQSNPAVGAQVSGYQVLSDDRIAVTVIVDRPDPSRAATCRVFAQAADFSTVAEQTITVPSGTAALTSVNLELKTLRRATTADVKDCRVL